MSSVFKINIILFSFLFVFCDQKMDYQVLDKTNLKHLLKEKKLIFFLENDNLKVFITNYGARIVSLIVLDRFVSL